MSSLAASLEKLDPDKNHLLLVPKEITSSTLTTRLNGVAKINQLIEFCNDLSSGIHSLGNESGSQEGYQEYIRTFRDWILESNIIEHIFGPNCHVEIIKQSHIILNFVAHKLNEDHVNVIWSASLLKHCGRQVLDQLTTLVRFMQVGPVLHLYWLTRNLNIEDHSEHTLLLASHILRYIWSHSPCINGQQNPLTFCNNNGGSTSNNNAMQASTQTHSKQTHLHSSQNLSSQQPHLLPQQSNLPQQQQQQHLRQTTVQNSLDPKCSEEEWLKYWRSGEFIDHSSDVSACCSDEKDMADFDDDAREFVSTDASEDDAEPDADDTDDDGGEENGLKDNLSLQQPPRPPTPVNPGNLGLPDGWDYDPQAQNELKNKIFGSGPISVNPDEELMTDQPQPSSSKQEHELQSNDQSLDAQLNTSTNDDDDEEDIEDELLRYYSDPFKNRSQMPPRSSPSELNHHHPNHGGINLHHHQQHHQLLHAQNQMQHLLPPTPQPQLQSAPPQLQPQEYINQFKQLKESSRELSATLTSAEWIGEEDITKLSEYNLSNLSESGRTLLWDLLQDGKIEFLPTNLHGEVENVLVQLVMTFGDRYIRYKFIEACLENLSVGTSVMISLRLLPKLMSFTSLTRNVSLPAITETHAIALWAEKEHKMSENFFKNLVDHYKQRQQLYSKLGDNQLKQWEELGDLNPKNPLFNHLEKIITSMSFLSFIYSKALSPESMRLTKEQMDQLWDCLASDSNLRCSDVLFQWIYQQAISDDFHGVNEELLDYVLKIKMPTLQPECFRLRGLKLLEQLLWIRQESECCHDLEHPATRLLWEIALKAIDDEVSLAAIKILNHFYIYTNHQKPTKCDKGLNFMRYSMEHLESCLHNLTDCDQDDPKNLSHLLDMTQKVILLIRTHLEVFKAHWAYYLRILQLNNEADLISHRLNAYEIKLTMTIRLVCQAASSADKTTIEVQASDFVGELRAEIVKWWYSQVDRSKFEQSTLASGHTAASARTEKSDEKTTDNYSQSIDGEKNKPQSAAREATTTAMGSGDDVNRLDSFTQFLLANHHSLRLLSHNQEIPFDWDERQINELDFKDMQVIYVLNEVTTTTTNNPEPHAAEDSSGAASDSKSSSNEQQVPQIAYIPKTEIPSLLLLHHQYFELLLEADRLLGSFKSSNSDLTTRAKALSRRVWEIIQILPTCPHYKEDLKRCGMLDYDCRLKSAKYLNLLSADSPQRLLYSLQIIDILKSSHENPTWGTVFIRKGGLADTFHVFMSEKLLPDTDEDWNEWLQECLAYLLKLLFQFGIRPPSQHSNNAADESGSSGSSRFSAGSSGSQNPRTLMFSGATMKRARRNRGRFSAPGEDRIPIPMFSEELLKLLADTDLIFTKLVKILKSSAHCKSQTDQYYYVPMSSRAMIVHHVMSFLASWCKSDSKFPKFKMTSYESLLKSLILDDTDASTRREACSGFYKLHLACLAKTVTNMSVDSINSTLNSTLDTSGEGNSMIVQQQQHHHQQQPSTANENAWTFSQDLLKSLIKFLPIAEDMKPAKPLRNYTSESEYIKDLNQPGCKDYFWLTAKMIESSHPSFISGMGSAILGSGNNRNTSGSSDTTTASSTSGVESPSTSDGSAQLTNAATQSLSQSSSSVSSRGSSTLSAIDLFDLCEYLVVAIRRRQTYETRDQSVEDDTLRGMLQIMVVSLRKNPSFRYTESAHEFVKELYQYLFAPPTQFQRYHPKCKSIATRSMAFDLMVALVDRSPKNYLYLLDLLLTDQHSPSKAKHNYPTDYWPIDECRSRCDVGFVGLVNLGATCYLATCMQHLFMIPSLRYAILSIEDIKNIRHGEIVRELQKIFTCLLESERKAFNPRNFCKVYTMDNHPLNIAEQTDMTEFLTDLITKLEESSPELRQIIKGLFSGTLSNNVVSLDCPHISRTTEEFYTLRVQVADMRSLNDSLDELTVKDTLEGDNMYTCSTCEKKVRAEKRACIVKLPRILCFNTMRYTFNMATMTKEKVNTHFSFPLRLDMADYLEANLMKRQQASSNSSNRGSSRASSSKGSPDSAKTDDDNIEGEARTKMNVDANTKTESGVTSDPTNSASASSSPSKDHVMSEIDESDSVYELIGVTVHTGNADGGHYYCFIRDCEDQSSDGKPRWYLFNDAEVKQFDDSHIGTECYGGELTTKSYDAINDRFVDFSIEKTNSAYMLFYKRVDYKYHSRSVATRYLESDTQRSTFDYGLGSRLRDLNESNSSLENMDLEGGEEAASLKSVTDNAGELSPTGLSADETDGKSSRMSGSDGGDVRTTTLTTATTAASESTNRIELIDFNELSKRTYEDFVLPRHLANWIWSENMKFSRDKNVFEHNYFNFMWQLCANLPKNLYLAPEVSNFDEPEFQSHFDIGDDRLSIRSVHLSIVFVLGVLMNSRDRPNLNNWTELIRKQFHCNKVASDWLLQMIDDEETWLKQLLARCPVEMVKQLFTRLCNDLNGSKQHKKLRLIK